MISFPNCKINLGLTVIGKRKDGYHDLETVFYPVQVNDILEIITCAAQDLHTAEEKKDAVILSVSGLQVAGNVSDNLCVKAYKLLKKDFPDLPPVKIHLHKVIPMGAGLGGGSADGAFALRLLNKKYQLNLTNNQLIDYAVLLGSDCPFFIINQPCFATSRGEMMEAIPVDLSGYTILLVDSGIHINTGWAFSQLARSTVHQPPEGTRALKDILTEPVTHWKDELANDFEEPVFDAYPLVKMIKDELYRRGALFAAMSGSGSTVFGIFKKGAVLPIELTSEHPVNILESR